MINVEQPLDLRVGSLERPERVPSQVSVDGYVGNLYMRDAHVFATYRFELSNGHQLDVTLTRGGNGSAILDFPTSGEEQFRVYRADGVAANLRILGELKTAPYTGVRLPKHPI
jgi:hypothetical protein